MRAHPRLAARAPAHLAYHLRSTLPAVRREAKVVARASSDPGLCRQLVDERLVAMVRHAHASVPYYRRSYDREVVQSFRGVEDLPKLPTIDRRAVQSKYRFVSATTDPRLCYLRKTSGSTGQPIEILRDLDVFFIEQSILGRLGREFAGARWSPLQTSFINLIHTPKPRSQRQPTMGFSKSYRFGLGEPAWSDPVSPLRFLSARRGYILSSSPSLLAELCRHRLEHDPQGRHPIRPSLVLSSGGPLSEATRALVAEQFGCPVVDAYVTEEVGIVAVECAAHRGFHVEAPACIVECLREDGSPTDPGESGELVLTGLRSKSFPLIRYRIGDTGSWAEEPCECGSSFPRLDRLIGRGGSVFVHRSGSPIAPASLGHALVGTPVLQYQIEQLEIDRFVFRYVKAPGARRRDVEAPVRALFELFFGAGVDLAVTETPELGASRTKVLPYICRVSPAGVAAEPGVKSSPGAADEGARRPA